MARPERLNEEHISIEMEALPFWTREGNSIVRELSAPDFASAVGLLNAVAVKAEAMDHHPELLIYGWNKLRITITTYDKGGLTALDFELAKRIDGLIF